MFNLIIKELGEHMPFTALGAIFGMVLLIIFNGISFSESYSIFYTLHPIHVFLSAFTTTSMYLLHKKGGIRGYKGFITLFLIGYVGSLFIATISDSLIPYIGEIILDLPNRGAHIGFIEEFWLVNLLAIFGIVLAYFKPFTKIPHSGHVFLSTAASLFHIIMALGTGLNFLMYFEIFVFLFIAVWIPCCTSDIIFPLIFVKEKD
ncbi:hypothetical protein HNP92_001641 [Methanococcus maripaludis]|uniref:Uncharacterized protein n=1 Tax=Methanococcus maripaludis TaxID=39152 RepID=A0A7J9S7B0_METMI|nr:hypothetical protein [Methanococcus maripaludis]MBA2853612.1 hypothetical protein [Methanococcus maripaludis]MBA2860747.1 hypothetical protein [Methanococcus maripaludis]MBA2869674.1 hypothetical protein [Methanococcus maripaludis]MBB6402319.1 hypothetical protein [Methanococcus maripaludis]